MTDWLIRGGLATIAGLTYLAGAIPSDMPWSGILQLPAQTYIYFSINVLSGLLSPSLVKAAGSVATRAVSK